MTTSHSATYTSLSYVLLLLAVVSGLGLAFGRRRLLLSRVAIVANGLYLAGYLLAAVMLFCHSPSWAHFMAGGCLPSIILCLAIGVLSGGGEQTA